MTSINIRDIVALGNSRPTVARIASEDSDSDKIEFILWLGISIFFFFSSDGYFLFFYSRAFKLFQQVGAKWSNEQKTFLTDRERGLKRSLLSQSGLSWNPRWPLTLYGDLTGNTHLTSELRRAFPDAYAYMHIVIYAFNYSQKVESFQRT